MVGTGTNWPAEAGLASNTLASDAAAAMTATAVAIAMRSGRAPPETAMQRHALVPVLSV